MTMNRIALYGSRLIPSMGAAIHVSSAGTITNRNKKTGIKMIIGPAGSTPLRTNPVTNIAKDFRYAI
jgi:hypothetical protein